MNVLVLPLLYSSPKFTGISMVNMMLDVIRCVNAVRNDVNWWVGVPRTKKFVEWDESEFEELERTKVLPILADDGMDRSSVHDGFCGLDHPFASPGLIKASSETGWKAFDVVLSNFYTAQMLFPMQAEYSDKHHYMLPKVGLPSIVNFLSETGLYSGLLKLRSRAGVNCLASSMAASKVTVVLSEADQKEALRLARSFLAPGVLRRLDIRTVFPSVNLDVVPRPERPEDRVTFFQGGTFETSRNMHSIARVVEKIRSMGVDARYRVLSQWRKGPDWLEKEFVDETMEANREAYLGALADGDFVPVWFDYAGTGLAYAEAIASGMTPIVLDRPWIKGRLPEDYELFVGSDAEMEKAMVWCAKHPQRAKEIGRRAVEFTREVFDTAVQGEVWSSVLEDAYLAKCSETRDRLGEKHFMVELARKAVSDMGEHFDASRVVQAIAQHSDAMDVGKIRSQWVYVRAILQMLGCREIQGGARWQESKWRKHA